MRILFDIHNDFARESPLPHREKFNEWASLLRFPNKSHL